MERFEEQKQSIQGDLDELEQKGDEMDERTDELEGDTDEVAEDLETKRDSPDAPGLQPK